MIQILRSLVVLFDTLLQILIRVGIMTKGEKLNLKIRIENLEEDINNEELDNANRQERLHQHDRETD
jgi:hypothetical protein